MTDPIRILLVEDDPDAARLTATRLEREDDRFVVAHAAGAEAGLERLADDPVDCVVSGYDMAPMDGVALLEAVREAHPRLPFILYTGRGSEDVASEAIAAGVTDYLPRGGDPDEPARLAERIRDAVSRDRDRAGRERQRAFTDAILDAVDDVVFVQDASGDLVRWNERAMEVSGYTDEELATMNAVDFVHPDHREETLAAITEVVEEGRARLEATLVTKDGRTIPYEFSAATVEGPDGETLLAGIGRDISHHVERERKLQRQNERLDEFTSVVSHDLRNPLNVAKGRLDLGMDEGEREHLEQVAAAHDRMERLIDNLLILAREGRRVDDPDRVALAERAEASWASVDTRRATHAVETDQVVRADEDQLARLLENFYRNAIEHAGADATVTTGALADGFYVEDDGPGIPPEEREAVFDAGFSTSQEGTGFGLSIAMHIADAHGWSIRVTDADAGGARFEVTGVDVEA